MVESRRNGSVVTSTAPRALALPRADHPAVGDDDGIQGIAHGEETLDVAFVREVTAVAVCDGQLVEDREQVQDGTGDARCSEAGCVPEDPFTDLAPLELFACQVRGGCCVLDRHAGPPREVLGLRGAVAGEVARRQPGESLVTLERRCCRHALFDQRVRELLASPRSAAHQGGQLRVHHHIGQPLARRVDTSASQRRGQIGAGRVGSVPERLCDDVERPDEHLVVEVEPAHYRRVRGVHPRRGELLHPPEVLRRDEVPRRAHHVSSHHLPLVDRVLDRLVGRVPHAAPHRPFRRGVVLRLYRTEVRDRFVHRPEPRADQALAREPQPRDVDASRHCQRCARRGFVTPVLRPPRDIAGVPGVPTSAVASVFELVDGDRTLHHPVRHFAVPPVAHA